MKKDILIEIFDRVLDKPAPPMNYTPKPRFRPSDMGSPCLRKIFYSYNRIPEDYPFELKMKKICKLGDCIHDLLSDTFREAGILIDYKNKDGSVPKSRWTGGPDHEFPVKAKDLEISGKIDAVLLIENLLWIGEYKSINDKGFTALKKPKPEHIIQAILYFYIFNSLLASGAFKHIPQLNGITQAQGIKFIYVNKNNSEMKEYSVTGGFEIFEETIRKMQTIKDYSKRKELPPTAYDWCKTCSWRRLCVQNKLK